MSTTTELLDQYRRYSGLLRSALGNPSPFTPESESATAIQVERGIAFPNAIIDPAVTDLPSVERLIEVSTSDRLGSIAIVDRSGHHRPVYRGLLVYSWLQAFARWFETLPRAEFGRWEEALRRWCDLLEGELGEIPSVQGPMPAGRGSTATESAWMALALHVAGKVFIRDAWTDLASDAFGKLVRPQQPDGCFLLATASDNPETHWYHELVLLHAAASYAVQAEDRTVAAAVVRATEFHSANTQPDHATTQPWAVFAFIWNPRTRPLADQVLHGSQGHDSTISLMLLADALYCVELFTK